MKKIECILSDQRLPLLEKTLSNWGVRGLTVSDVRGYGEDPKDKIKMELYCQNEDLDDVLALIKRCFIGIRGDYKIAVFDALDLVSVEK